MLSAICANRSTDGIIKFSTSWCKGVSSTVTMWSKTRRYLSPKGEFFKELYEGSLWFECLSFTLSYYNLEVIFHLEPVMTGGRTGKRAGVRMGVFSHAETMSLILLRKFLFYTFSFYLQFPLLIYRNSLLFCDY